MRCYRERLTRVSSVVLGILLLVLVLLELNQVVMRYLFGAGLFWTAEVSTLVMMSLAWLGAAHLWLLRGHLAIDLIGTAHARWHRLIDVVADLLVIAGVLWLSPKIATTLDAYWMIELGSLPVSASVSYLPMSMGVLLLAGAATLNLMDWLRSVQSE